MKRGLAMAQIGKLSAIEVAKAKGPAVLHDGGGLYLRVSTTGSKAWVFRFQLDGKRRDMGLGPYPDISLAEARRRATEHRNQRRDGIDPLEAKAAQRQAQRLATAKGRTFRECAAEFMDKNRAGWRNAKHRQQWENTLATYVYPALGELPVSAIDTGLVLQVLDPIWTEKPETASRVRGRIEAVLDAATVRGFRQGPNPAQWKSNLAHNPARQRAGAEGGAPCGAAIRSDARVPRHSAEKVGHGGTGARIRGIDRSPHRRGSGSMLGRNRSDGEGLDRAG
jgi:Phage integrase central domain/Arm DNA-binding domain